MTVVCKSDLAASKYTLQIYETENVEQIDPHAGGNTNTVDSWTDIQIAFVNNLMFTHTGAMSVLASAAGRHATADTPTALHNSG